VGTISSIRCIQTNTAGLIPLSHLHLSSSLFTLKLDTIYSPLSLDMSVCWRGLRFPHLRVGLHKVGLQSIQSYSVAASEMQTRSNGVSFGENGVLGRGFDCPSAYLGPHHTAKVRCGPHPLVGIDRFKSFGWEPSFCPSYVRTATDLPP